MQYQKLILSLLIIQVALLTYLVVGMSGLGQKTNVAGYIDPSDNDYSEVAAEPTLPSLTENDIRRILQDEIAPLQEQVAILSEVPASQTPI